MARKVQHTQAIKAPENLFYGSGTYALAFHGDAIVASKKISMDCIHPVCVSPDPGSYTTNGGAAFTAAQSFKDENHDAIIMIAVGSCHEFLHATLF